jgi:GNAT superfamily N-acetyltransferase
LVSAVRQVTDEDIAPMAAALARAFDDDPVMAWAFGRAPRRLRRLRRFFAYEARRHRLHGEVLTNDLLEGGAFWDPPERWRVTWGQFLKQVPTFAPIIGPRLPRVLKGLQVIEDAHPRQPHWYLAILGTDPPAQGHGVGATLLQPVLDRCDAQGLGAYLESSKEANLAYYARFGFTVTGQIDLPHGPPMWPMWREPRTAAA